MPCESVKVEETAAQLVVDGYLHMFLIEDAFIHEKSANIATKKIKQRMKTPTLRLFCD